MNNLKSLTLKCLKLLKFVVPDKSLPNLESINLSNNICDIEQFDVTCPTLKLFDSEHTFINDFIGFNKSINKWSQLENIYTYKFRNLCHQYW